MSESEDENSNDNLGFIDMYGVILISVVISIAVIIIPHLSYEPAEFSMYKVYQRTGAILITISIISLLVDINKKHAEKPSFLTIALADTGIKTVYKRRSGAYMRAISIKGWIYGAIAIIGTLFSSW